MNSAKILIVDDEPAILSMLESYLTSVDLHPVCASSVEVASAIIAKEPIKVLVVDWRLGSNYGSEVIKAARAANPLLPVIVISGQTMLDVATEAFLAGADTYLPKPVQPTILVQIINRWLKRVDSFLPTSVEEIIPFAKLKQKYFQTALNLAGSVTRASELLDVDRQTVSAVVKTVATGDIN
jgi:DNA-binding NtrC family response regulator